MKFVVGTETGLVKLVDCTQEPPAVTDFVGYQSFNRNVVGLHWVSDTEFCYLTKTGELFTVHRTTFKETRLAQGISAPCGLAFENEKFITCSDKGQIQVRNRNGNLHYRLNTENYIECFSVRGDKIALGAKQRAPEVWDLKKQKRTWKAIFVENPPPKKRKCTNQTKKVHVKACVWLEDDRIASVTAYGQYHLFDINCVEPLVDVDICDTALQCIAVDPFEKNVVYTGSGEGIIYKINSETGQVYMTLKQAAGGIRTIQIPTPGILAAVGADKYLRLYDTTQRFQKVKQEVYLKARLTKLLTIPDSGKKEEEVAPAENDVWEELTGGKKRARGLLEEGSPVKKQKLSGI